MKHILAPEHRGVLARFASLPTLYAFDFDGTLAPFTEAPHAAQMRPATLALFVELAERRPCAVISGRARDDLTPRLGGAPLAGLVGNHGIEPQQATSTFALTIRELRATVVPQLQAIEGVFVEDKGFTLAVHYRRAPDPGAARSAIHRIVDGVPDVRLLGGELVVNVIPKGAPNKGHGLLGLLEQNVLGAAVYVGDDETDEDVFRLEGPPELLSIRVGYSQTTRAAYFIEHQEEIDRLLEALIDVRPS